MQSFNISSIYVLVFLTLLDSVIGFTSPSVRVKDQRKKLPTRRYEKPSWLDDAMEGIPSEGLDPENYKNGISLERGIAGFSVDPELGFVSILVAKNDSDGEAHWVPAVISPADTDRPKSAEALTCVQLAGGLDLGTAILPPNTLAKLVANHNAEEEDTSSSSGINDGRFSLKKVTAVINTEGDDDNKIRIEEDVQEVVATSPERDQTILEAVPKVEKAVKSLPGLEASTTEDVTKAIQRFADQKGEVDRDAFSAILDALRKSNTPSISLASPLFRLDVSIIGESGISQATIDTTDTMIALGLAMRYKVTVDIEDAENHKEGGVGKDSLLERFPAFRPIQELGEDSKIMDGFIPSMFEKAKLDNDMKGE